MSLLSRLAVSAARAYGALSSNPNNVNASYLVVAGGGGAASGASGLAGGGGGAGGYLTSTATLSTLNTYSITVGAGGAGGVNASGVAGSNSVLSGTGLTTVTSTGGGRGGTYLNAGGAGGSGGGGAYNGNAGGTATASPTQGNNGGAGTTSLISGGGGGGGGGASAVGTAGSGTVGGGGGAGSSSSISGSSVTYAGGGGGSGTTAGAGGSGGGATAGTWPSGSGNAGTANTGGGGGGGGNGDTGGAGGSGVVIISYTSATPKFVGGTLTTSGGNQIHTFTSSGTLSPLTPVTASYLVVAGGGGGGYDQGGGGGAGGLLTSSTTLYSGATYVVTVGAGGAGATSNQGTSGSNSVLSGTGLTTLTSSGGGGGGGDVTRAGLAGGSGGGTCGVPSPSTGGAGTVGQGNNGGTSSGSPSGGSGGGGAGAVGTVNSAYFGGAGGVGSTSSISGTSTYYAGGGGGGANGTGGSTGGAGGLGGGGAGASGSGAGTGTTNTGGGGGGGYGLTTPNRYGAAGGSGTVIISYAGSQVFNGGLVTSSGGNTIHTFNATGALTPLTNNLNNSLRFRGSNSAYLNRTPASATNRRTWTWSGWVKRGSLGASSQVLFSAGSSSSVNVVQLFFSSDKLSFQIYDTGTVGLLESTALYRDPAAWYHIVAVLDTTQATSTNRMKLYVNGNQVTAFGTATYPSQNFDAFVNTVTDHSIGNLLFGTRTNQLDGYLTDVNFIDGQALEPYYFGNNDAYGNWKPILYKGMYGTNGFYLTFGNTTSTTTLGYDSSPNGNNWTTNNISLTAGTTYDAMTDVPTNTSATVANYATWNPLLPPSSASEATNVLDGNLQLKGYNAAYNTWAVGTIEVSSGKWYYEFTNNNAADWQRIGIISTSGKLNPTDASAYYMYYSLNGNKISNVSSVAYGNTWTTNDIIGVALDLDNGKIFFSKNGTWQASGDPAAGTNAAYTGLTGAFAPASLIGSAVANSAFVNFGQRPFTYTPPSGFVRLNTYNLPSSTIPQGNKYMDATTFTGNGVTNVIVNQGQFKPDLVWIKSRSSVQGHGLYNPLMSGYILDSSSTAAQAGVTPITDNSNGFTMPDAVYNNNAVTYVGWQWQAGQGSSSSNTNGSITSTVSVNTTAGFSVVTYTGTGANATVGHGLGVAPKMLTVKRRSAVGNWMTWHTSLTGTGPYVILNSTNGVATGAWNNTLPTSTVFSLLGSDTDENANGSTYVAYCWAEIAGFSKFGSYTGNGSADGTFIFTNFQPRYVMFKRTDTTSNWNIDDGARNTYNATDILIAANNSNADASPYPVDFLSNGIKLRSTLADINASGGTYIYACFASNPFKNSNAR